MRHPLAKLIGRTAVIAGVIASFAFPVLAQDGTGPMPQNAQPRSYGDAWVCDLGYRVEGAECLALDIPEHAYAASVSGLLVTTEAMVADKPVKSGGHSMPDMESMGGMGGMM